MQRTNLGLAIAMTLLITNSAKGTVQIQPVAISGLSGTSLGFGPGLGTEIHYNTFEGASLNNRGDVVFHAQLTGAGITGANRGGIWTRFDSQPELVARTGTQGPSPNLEDGVYYESLLTTSGFAFNDHGTVAFIGRLNDGSRSVWLRSEDNLTLVARGLDHSPGPNVEGRYFQLFGAPSLNERNEVAFQATIAPDFTTSATERGIWSSVGGTLAVIARGGESGPRPDHPDGMYYYDSRFVPSVFSSARLNDHGQIAFRADAQKTPLDQRWNGLWLHQDNAVQLIARTGDEPGPNLGKNWEFGAFRTNDDIDNESEPILNNQGAIAFRARVHNDVTLDESRAGIWTTAGGTLAPVALSGGDQLGPNAGSDIEFSATSFSHPEFNDRGEVAFRASLIGPEIVQNVNDSGIWINVDSQLRAVARTGSAEAGPALEDGVFFRSLGVPLLNDVGQLAFFAVLTGEGIDTTNDSGIWGYTDGALTNIVREGDRFDVNPAPGIDDFRTIGLVRSDSLADLNNLGTSLLRLRFTDGTNGLFTADLDQVPEAGVMAILFSLIPIAYVRRRRRSFPVLRTILTSLAIGALASDQCHAISVTVSAGEGVQGKSAVLEFPTGVERVYYGFMYPSSNYVEYGASASSEAISVGCAGFGPTSEYCSPAASGFYSGSGVSYVRVSAHLVTWGDSGSVSAMASGGGTPDEPEPYLPCPANCRGQESEPAAGAYLASVQIDVPVVEEHGLTDFVWANAASDSPSPNAKPFRAAYFFDSTEIPFTHFTVPESLPGGDSEFQIVFGESESHALQAGAVFDFTAHIPEGVSTFLLTGFNANEGLLSDEPFPHTHGYRFAQEGATFVRHGALSPGDFTRGGIVDYEDYRLWKSSFGMTGDLAADGNNDGIVDAADYTVWRNHLLVESQRGSPIDEISAATPEPPTLLLLIIFALANPTLPKFGGRSFRL